jgi:3-oxoacyl-[acyl-carrier-protein] synthase III
MYEEEKNINNWDSTLFLNPFIKLENTRYKNKESGIWADGRCISSTIIKEMPDFIKERLKKWNLSNEKIDNVFIHQLGDNVTFATLRSLGIEKNKLPVNMFNEFGNLACANLPVALSIAKEKNILRKRDNILLFSSSCGISYSILHIKW